ncbi:MAG: response regulator transcription factor [Lentisphaerales bacterium]|nr:response regulator transcription factor [Lentisphaerales bacterium]
MMKDKKIMVVDDEADIRELIRFNLEKEGFEVVSVSDGETALEEARLRQPDLILLDVMLPGIDGVEVCFKLKSDVAFKSIPIVMLSAKSDESDQLVGLKIGADDYLVKPFSPKVLVAKIGAILRRGDVVSSSSVDEEPVIRFKGLYMNPNDFSVSYKEAPLKLTAVEYKILYFLARKPGRVYTRERIIEQVRGDDVIITGRTVDVHILSLRRKLGDAADLIETVRGIGYKVQE